MMSQGGNGIATKICSQCGYEGEPLDALFFLQSAAMLIPMTLGSLRKFLSRRGFEFPSRYGHYGPQRRRYRLLTGGEIKRIRSIVLTQWDGKT